jgi:hypothetical protein
LVGVLATLALIVLAPIGLVGTKQRRFDRGRQTFLSSFIRQ